MHTWAKASEYNKQANEQTETGVCLWVGIHFHACFVEWSSGILLWLSKSPSLGELFEGGFDAKSTSSLVLSLI